MLVLSRKKDQQVIIDGEIKIEVLKVKGNTVRLGISAPSHVKVLRGELKPFGMESAPEPGSQDEAQQILACLLPIANAG